MAIQVSKKIICRFAGVGFLALLFCGGCCCGSHGGPWFASASPRVPPPGTGSYTARNDYYRGPESASLGVNDGALIARASGSGTTHTQNGVDSGGYAPNPSSSGPTTPFRSQYGGMPVSDLTTAVAPLVRGQSNFPTTEPRLRELGNNAPPTLQTVPQPDRSQSGEPTLDWRAPR
jgi:hypothetical protein